MQERSPNPLLYDAVIKSNFPQARLALSNGANPSFMVKECPLLCIAPNAAMISFLLEHGADPNDRWPHTNYTILERIFRGSNHVKLAALVNHRPCTIHNATIIRVLLLFIHREILEKNFKWDHPEGNALLLLIRASTDLQECLFIELPPYTYFHWSPVHFALCSEDNRLLEAMISNNDNLYRDVKSKKISFHQLADTEKFYRQVNEFTVMKFFQALSLCQLFLFGSKCDNSVLTLLPMDVIKLIILNKAISQDFPAQHMERYVKQIHENSALAAQMFAFGKIYSILNDSEYTRHTFWEKNKQLPASSFFAKAYQAAADNKSGLTAKTLPLSVRHQMNISPDNEELVASLVGHCNSIFSSKERTEQEVRDKLSNSAHRM